MGNHLSKRPLSTDLATQREQANIERQAENADVADIYTRGVRDFVAERIQAAKAQFAEQLTAEIHDHTNHTTRGLYKSVQDRVETPGLNQEFQQRFEAFTHAHLDDYDQQARAIENIGVQSVAREAQREVNLPLPEKKKWPWQR